MRVKNVACHCLLLVLLSSGFSTAASEESKPRTIDQRTAGLECQGGFLPFCWDAREGKLLVEVGRLGQPLLYVASLASGVGSNALGLDRGSAREALVRFERVGPKVLLIQENMSFRAPGGSDALQQGVEEQFATSTLAAWEVEAEQDSRVLIDATEFFLSDSLGVVETLERSGQGTFRLEAKRSAVHLPRTRAFARNTEVEASLTFLSAEPGPLVRRTTPSANALTLRVHHSLLALPEEPLRPRRFNIPRVGLFPMTFQDYSQPLHGRLQQRWIVRWRLEGKSAGEHPSSPVRPIVYHLDPAMPEPVRSAIREGAGWWTRLFEAAGFKDAFQVKDLPAGADPMDARYSIIQWGHRADRGWSWGNVLTDPRSGEILRAVVFMDSHRMRTDHNLWAGVQPAVSPSSGDWTECRAGAGGVPDWIAALDPTLTSEEFVLARIRQLAAHEVGHTLGLAHNFAASTYGRASVMDYPAPLLYVKDGNLDLSEAYRPGAGEYDEFAIRYGYSIFAPEEEESALAGIVAEGLRQGMVFLSDRDARPLSASDARAQLWDNRREPLEELFNSLAVRRLLLERFSESALAEGEPLGLLEERLAPVYFHHRFALEAATKLVGGMGSAYAVRGDGQEPTRIVQGKVQRQALQLLIEALKPEALALPLELLEQLAPKPFGYAGNTTGEEFGSKTWPAFDELGAARTLASGIVSAISEPARAARLVAFRSRQPSAPGLAEVIDGLVDATWRRAEPDDPRMAALARVVERAVLDALFELAGNAQATVEVRAISEEALWSLGAEISKATDADPAGEALRRFAERDIRRFFRRNHDPEERSTPLDPPPGSPIGTQ